VKIGFRWPQRRQQNGVILRPPIKGRIPPINGSTPLPFYQWTLLERQKPAISLIKGIATVGSAASWNPELELSDNLAENAMHPVALGPAKLDTRRK
jgi:hypothetical protein